ncbi:hypothetical protein L1987_30781 [Smallanthus sonchifolius]|uniref:Uncharacterized protein n=1 Tax=Smallanthus sonchifolius TaxID=185202 RepID=A0ACB9I4E4_9ASTR|nr:hypothetical protein L1987_30781 [Smallanthus sonchifolius]
MLGNFKDLFMVLNIKELSKLSNLKNLDLSLNNLNITPSMEGCKSLTRLERLESVSLGGNNFNKSIISCLSFLPSLNFLDLSSNQHLGSSFSMQGIKLTRHERLE